EALSDSTVIRDCSSVTLSPTCTSTSITSTSSKSPMSGTRICCSLMAGLSLQKHAAEVGQHLTQVGVEARTGGPVDDAVVVRQRQRQDQARLEFLAVPDWLHGA